MKIGENSNGSKQNIAGADDGASTRVYAGANADACASAGKKTVKRIVLTGGGSAGHVIPNLILLPDMIKDGWDIHYIGSRKGIEATLVKHPNITYHTIETGKLRRYFDIKNFIDPFRVIAGFFQSLSIIARIGPCVIFSKGGFVAVPVVLAGWLLRRPIVIHESDMSQGLANKICIPLSSYICLSFQKTYDALPAKVRKRAAYTGAPVRNELDRGDAREGYRLCGFDDSKPVLLVIGGSQGSEGLNKIIRSALPELLNTWHIAHLCGRGGVDATLENTSGYAQFEYVGDELAHLYKISRAAVSRAGSNTIFELLYLRIPSVLIPIPLKASRGDQILNAEEFAKAGFSIKLDEDMAENIPMLIAAINDLDANYDCFVKTMVGAKILDAKNLILNVIYKAALKYRGFPKGC